MAGLPRILGERHVTGGWEPLDAEQRQPEEQEVEQQQADDERREAQPGEHERRAQPVAPAARVAREVTPRGMPVIVHSTAPPMATGAVTGADRGSCRAPAVGCSTSSRDRHGGDRRGTARSARAAPIEAEAVLDLLDDVERRLRSGERARRVVGSHVEEDEHQQADHEERQQPGHDAAEQEADDHDGPFTAVSTRRASKASRSRRAR